MWMDQHIQEGKMELYITEVVENYIVARKII